jgi:hypothetical protein
MVEHIRPILGLIWSKILWHPQHVNIPCFSGQNGHFSFEEITDEALDNMAPNGSAFLLKGHIDDAIC